MTQWQRITLTTCTLHISLERHTLQIEATFSTMGWTFQRWAANGKTLKCWTDVEHAETSSTVSVRNVHGPVTMTIGRTLKALFYGQQKKVAKHDAAKGKVQTCITNAGVLLQRIAPNLASRVQHQPGGLRAETTTTTQSLWLTENINQSTPTPRRPWSLMCEPIQPKVSDNTKVRDNKRRYFGRR